MPEFTILPLTDAERPWAAAYVAARWGAVGVVARGELYHPHTQDGCYAALDGQHVGLITYRIAHGACEITLLDSAREGIGIGRALIDAVRQRAVEAGCRRLWLITTNDNLHALHFYQRYGFVLAALYPNALVKSRALKPEIPRTGYDDLPLRDEIELELAL